MSCDNHFCLKNGVINEGYLYASVHLTLKGANHAESLGLSAIDKQTGVCSFKPKNDLCYDHKDNIGIDLDHAFWIKVNNKTRSNHRQRQSNSPQCQQAACNTATVSPPVYTAGPGSPAQPVNPGHSPARPGRSNATSTGSPPTTPWASARCHISPPVGGRPGGGSMHGHQRQARHQTYTGMLNMASSQASFQQPCRNDIQTATPWVLTAIPLHRGKSCMVTYFLDMATRETRGTTKQTIEM